jgi:hypothetical protein
MTRSEKERLNTADLAAASEADRPDVRERVVNRADAFPSTDRAESLWDETVKHERPVETRPRRCARKPLALTSIDAIDVTRGTRGRHPRRS